MRDDGTIRPTKAAHLVVGGERGDAVDSVAAEQEAEVAVNLAVEVVRLGPVVGDDLGGSRGGGPVASARSGQGRRRLLPTLR